MKKLRKPVINASKLENDGSINFQAQAQDVDERYEYCVCQGGSDYGHHNEAGGYCCPHWGNTCGHHPEYH